MTTVIASSVYNITDMVRTIKSTLDVSLKTTSGDVIEDDGTDAGTIPDQTYYGSRVIVSSNEPTGLNQTTDVGLLWRDEDSVPATIKWWDGYVFSTYTGTKYPPGVGLESYYANVARRGVTSAQLYNQATAPAHTGGRFWRDTDDSKVYRSDGTNWVEITDALFKNAVQTLIDINTAATGVTYPVTLHYTTAAPGGATKGSVWFDTDNVLQAYWFDGTNWVSYEGDVRVPAEEPATDGFPPPGSPTPSVLAGFGAFFIEWAPVSNTDPVTYDIYAGTTSGFTANSGSYLFSTESTFAVAYTTPAGAAWTDNTTWYFKIIARDADGAAAPGTASSAATVRQLITSTTISDNAITTPKLDANAVTAAYLVANNAWIEALRTVSLVGETITGAIIRTSSTATTNGVQMTTAGLKGYKAGVEKFSISSTGDVVIGSGATIAAPVITGGTFQTATSGERVVLTSTTAGLLSFYSDDANRDDANPGGILVDTVYDATALLYNQTLQLSSGRFTGSTKRAHLYLRTGRDATNTFWSTSAVLDADIVTLDGSGTGKVTVDGNFAYVLGNVILGDTTSRQIKRVYFGSDSDTPNGSGEITYSHGLGFAGAYQVWLQSRNNGAVRIFNVSAKNANNFVFDVKNSSGANVTSGTVGFEYLILEW